MADATNPGADTAYATQAEATASLPLRRRLWMVAFAMSLAISAICAWSVVRSRGAATEQARTQVRSAAVLLSNSIAALLDKSSLAAGAVASAVQRQMASGGIDRTTLWRIVDDELARVPQLTVVGIFDASGRQICGEPASRCRMLDVSDRPYFQASQQQTGTFARLYGPYRSRVDGDWTLVMAQPMQDPQGRFAGVVAALLPLTAVQAVLGGAELGPSGTVSLRRADLALVARQPGPPRSDEEARNTLVSEELAAAVHESRDEGLYRAVTPLDGIERYNAYRRVRGYPLLVIAGLASTDFLAAWRTETAWIAGFLALFLGAAGVIVTLLGQGIRRREVIADLYDNAPCGYHSIDADGVFRHINATELRWLGCTRGQVLGKLKLPDFLTDDSKQRFQENLAQLRAEGHVEGAEYDLVGRDDGPRHVLVAANAMKDKAGHFKASAAVMHDITELHRTREQLRTLTEDLDRRVIERTAQLRTLAAELELAESRERHQIARDLHDDLAQTLAAARIRLAPLCQDERPAVRADAQEVDSLIRSADRATRSLATQLAPAVLYELGLVPALEGLADEIENRYRLSIDVEDDGQDKPLSQDARSMVYRAVRELLINVAKHARAPSALVEISREGDEIVVRVSDAGVGFDPAVLLATPSRGLGLVSVRERLSFIGGSVTLRSIPGDGTVAVLRVPVSGDEADEEPAT